MRIVARNGSTFIEAMMKKVAETMNGDALENETAKMVERVVV